MKHVVQRKRKVGNKKIKVVGEEVKMLKNSCFITRIKYPTCLANMVLVRTTSNKWHMCVNFTNLNATCPKYLYLLPNIDRIIDGSLVYMTLSFKDVYFGYNQINMELLDASNTVFMSNHGNYYYIVIPFRLKSSDTSYKRLMDVVLSYKIGFKLWVYINDMIVKTLIEGSHCKYLEDILKPVRR